MSGLSSPAGSTVPPPRERRPRGGGFVLAQGVLLVLLLFGPRHLPGQPGWQLPGTSGTGALLFAAGLLFAAAGAWPHGRHLTPWIRPGAGSALLERGPYRLVRHPIYGGLILAALGWTLLVQGWLTLLWTLLLALLLDRKAAAEERWLLRTFPGYAAYRRRVRHKLLPLLY